MRSLNKRQQNQHWVCRIPSAQACFTCCRIVRSCTLFQVMDTCSILLFALLHSKQVMDKITLTRCKKLQQFICDSRRAHIECSMQTKSTLPTSSSCNHVAQQMIAKAIDGEIRTLGIADDVLYEERIDLDSATDADFSFIFLSALTAIQSHVVCQLRTEAAFKTICASALRATQTSLQTTALSRAGSEQVYLRIIIERNQTATRLQEHLATPVGLMSSHGWKQWRRRVQLDLARRYPRAHVTVCMQPFGDRIFQQCNPACHRNVILIWDSLEIVAHVTYPFNAFGVKQTETCYTDHGWK